MTMNKQHDAVMTTQVQFNGFNARPGVRALIEDGLRDLRTLTLITAATVRLERRRECSPAMQAQVNLAVAGPDIHVTAADHTVQAVWLKALKNLRRQIERRKTKLRRRNTGEQLVHGPENRRNGAPGR